MEANKCTSSTATAKNQFTLNDLDDYSLGIIFNKLSYIDRTRVGSVCHRWYAVSNANWCTYLKCLIVDKVLVPLCGRIVKNGGMLVRILQRAGPYLEEITFKKECRFYQLFPMGTIKWITELCPKLKRLNTGFLVLHISDCLACSNLEVLSFKSNMQRQDFLGVLFRSNKRLRRLAIFDGIWLATSDFDHLDPGQLEFLRIEGCIRFNITAEIADKFTESLVGLTYSIYGKSTPNFQPLGKLKNLRSIDLKVSIKQLDIEFIAYIARNCRKLERVFLAIFTEHAYDQNFFTTLFDLPYLRRLLIIVDENNVPSKNQRDSLLQRATQLELFVIDTCDNCMYGCFDSCYRHRRGWQW